MLSAETAGVAAEAEASIRDLNAAARPALAPLARLLLRTESIASSEVEGLQLGASRASRKLPYVALLPVADGRNGRAPGA